MSTDVTGERTLASLLEHQANVRPSAPALVTHHDSVSWERLATELHTLRRQLAGAGVSDQARVVVALPNAPLAIALWLAVPANGAVVQVVDPDSGALAVRRALDATRPLLAITTAEHAELYRDAIAGLAGTTRLVVVDEAELAGLQLPAVARPAHPDDAGADHVASLLPTSGTSGAPKLVELTHRNLVTSAERLARNGGYLATDRHYLCSPLFHTNGQAYLCAPPFVTGGSIALVPRFSAGRWFDDARELGATVASMVAPPMRMALHRALEHGQPVDPGPLRAVHYGMTLSAADWKAWDRLVPDIHMRQIYGQTESVTAVLGGAPWESDDRHTIGRPFLGVEPVRLVGPDGNDVPDGESGELWVQGRPGHTLMRGYHNAPDATAETLLDGGWLRTGDQMIRHQGGRFEFRGRAMHIIRRGGENLSTYALETDLASCPLLSDVAVAARADDTLDAVVVAHVIPATGYTEEGFLRWCQENIGKRGTPDVVREHHRFPRTGSGRVILRELE
jgi:crotonobetaine/carnitine-CoA ligase